MGDAPYGVAFGDFDADGYGDFVVANSDDYNISVLLNRGDGTFVEQGRYAAGRLPGAVAAADLDADGDMDIAVINAWSESLSILLNLRGGRGDLNCDGRVDRADVDPFVLALVDAAGYSAQYPDCGRLLADCNDDGLVNTFDIDAFVDLLTGG